MQEKDNCPVIIISVFRSGSNLVKDIVCSIPGYCTWQAENINFIWRHGNIFRDDDELSVNDASDDVVGYIRNKFDRLLKTTGCDNIVEKTESNTLRIGFVDTVFPCAKYIFVMRDGRDAIASMLKRRQQPFDLIFLLKKIRYLQITDILMVAIKYFIDMFGYYFNRKNKIYKLGPVYKGMEKMLYSCTEEEVVAMQWSVCMSKAFDDIHKIDPNRVYFVKYEELVGNVNFETFRLIDFLEPNLSNKIKNDIINKIANSSVGRETSSSELKGDIGVTNKSIGRWKTQFDDESMDRIWPIIKDTMRKIDYN